MALDRWIALIILGISLAYGYGAFFTMDQLLPPFMQRNPIWPSTFPKLIAVLSIICALVILLGLEKSGKPRAEDTPASVYHALQKFHLRPAFLLLALMVAYALLLRPVGFLLSTAGFLIIGAAILGERRWLVMGVVATGATGIVWYLVQVVLGIFLRPLPSGLGF